MLEVLARCKARSRSVGTLGGRSDSLPAVRQIAGVEILGVQYREDEIATGRSCFVDNTRARIWDVASRGVYYYY